MSIANSPRLTGTPLFTNPTVLPLRTIASIVQTPVLVVAPHPDDETLGCGGAIALLRQAGCEVRVLVISDGTLSHPRSRKYPAPALRDLRESETLAAMAGLSVAADQVTFLRLPDGAVPTPEFAAFADAVKLCCTALAADSAQLVFVPWRNDPHPDHRATWQLMQATLKRRSPFPRLIEYPIWDWDPKQRGSLSAAITAWRLDISPVLPLKQRAIEAYRSQITNLIDDDPEGFRFTPELLAHFAQPWEMYLEADYETCNL